MPAETPPDPLSLRQRGRRHHGAGGDTPHPGQFYGCTLCWPGAVLCGACGHVTVEGEHGHMKLTDRGLVLLQRHPCTAAHDDSRPCGCRLQWRPERVVHAEPAVLPGSSPGPTPAPFRFSGPSLSGYRRRRH